MVDETSQKEKNYKMKVGRQYSKQRISLLIHQEEWVTAKPLQPQQGSKTIISFPHTELIIFWKQHITIGIEKLSNGTNLRPN